MLAERRNYLLRRELAQQAARRQMVMDRIAMMREQRLAQQEQERADREQRQTEMQDFNIRASLLKAGYAPASRQDEQLAAAAEAPRYRIGMEGPPEQIGTGTDLGRDISNRMLDYGKRKYMAPAPEEIQKRMLEAKEAETALAVDRAKRIAEAREAAKPAVAPKAAVQIPGRDVPYSEDVMAQKLKLKAKPAGPKGTAGGEGSLAGQRLKLAIEKQKQDQLQALESRESKLEDEVRAARNVVQKVEGQAKAIEQTRLKLKELQLARIRKQKLDLGFTTAEDIGRAPAAPNIPKNPYR
jgi:hypothetical protein